MKNQNAQEAKNQKANSATNVETIAKKVDAMDKKIAKIETKVEKSVSKVSEKTKGEKPELKVTLLVNPLSVYSRKAMDGKPSNIKAGSEVILTPLENSIRVKKPNSSRTFYTNKEEVNKAVSAE